jgi:hypothetical protein
MQDGFHDIGTFRAVRFSAITTQDAFAITHLQGSTAETGSCWHHFQVDDKILLSVSEQQNHAH